MSTREESLVSPEPLLHVDPADGPGEAGPRVERPELFDLPHPGEAVRVESKESGVRLPDPPLIMTEQSAPFDLPVLGPRVRVQARLIPPRLPEPHDV